MLNNVPVMLGCDPECFIFQGGKVIGAEKVIPESGLDSLLKRQAIVLDGVQFEIHTHPRKDCSALGDELAAAFTTLRHHLREMPEVTVSFNSVVKVTRKELKSLSERARQLLCQPSKNFWGLPPLSVPKNYPKRSAGGHVQLGLYRPIFDQAAGDEERARIVPLLDVLLGNTCVMLDRDPEAAERRKVYGRAGEYRLPKHGLEYRTLSNFWLRAYSLTDLVFGLAQMAVSTLATTLSGQEDLEDKLCRSVNFEHIITAIQTNDRELARENFKPVREFIEAHGHEGCVLNGGNLNQFERFLEPEDPIKEYFQGDPVIHWTEDIRENFSQFLGRI